MRILFIGDIMGRPGREAAAREIPMLKEEYGGFDFIIANGENSAGGFGLTEKVMKELFASGIDILTNGNHVWDKKDFVPLLDSEKAVLRPANHPQGTRGRGYAVYEKNGERLAVLCLQGRTFMPPLDCPFQTAERLVAECPVPAIFVDIHAEATSEKRALGVYLDGKVSAVVGTHTHVQTADEQFLPKGTAYITDLGMCGAHDSVLGVKKENAIEKFRTRMPVVFEKATEDIRLCGIFVDTDNRKIERIGEKIL